jgi:uncharacterized protein (DUF2062 family)
MQWFRERVWNRLLRLMRAGLSPEGLAWSLSVGLALGINPMYGTSTVLCLGVAMLFRLNQPAMQLANYLAYPLQLALLIPFIRLGERLFGAPRLPISIAAVQESLKAGVWAMLQALWTSLWHASVVWLLVVPIPAALLAWVLIPIFRATQRNYRGRRPSTDG